MKCDLCGKPISLNRSSCPDCTTPSVQSEIETLLKNAIHFVSEDIKSEKDQGKLYFRMGNFHRLSGRYDEAIQCYEKSFELLPNEPEVLRCLGSTYAGKHHYSEAERYIKRAVQLAKNYADYHSDLGAALFKNRKYDEAIVSFREAIRINPRFANAHNNLAMALRKKSKHEEAEAEIRKAIECDPEHAVAEYELGQGYFSGGMFSQLKEKLQISSKILGDIYLMQRLYDKAIEHYEKAVKMHPDYPDYYFALGQSYEAKGDTKKALKTFETALQLNPRYDQVRVSLQRLSKKGCD
jgi:tetratricopeptide (TPR) repeat protein